MPGIFKKCLNFAKLIKRSLPRPIRRSAPPTLAVGRASAQVYNEASERQAHRIIATLPYTNHNSAGSSSPSPSGGVSPPISWSDIFRTRAVLRRALPLELVDIILHHAEYYYAIAAWTPHSVVSAAKDLAVLSISLNSKQAKSVIGMSLTIKEKNGWYPDPVPATWYTLGTEDEQSHEEPLVFNPNAAFNKISAIRTLEFHWDAYSPRVKQLKEDGIVEFWAHSILFVAVCIIFYLGIY